MGAPLSLRLTYWEHVAPADRGAFVDLLPIWVELRGRGRPHLYVNPRRTAMLLVRTGRFGFLSFRWFGLPTDQDKDAACAEFPSVAPAPRSSKTGEQKPKKRHKSLNISDI